MSSNDFAIRVNQLSKAYQIYARPQDRLKQSIQPRLQRLMGMQPKQYFHEFWALHDVSFDINRGETFGIIGRNGSGKSTLLQMICGTLTPTSGSVQTNGRIAALLELGSGFNPEFTGRENVYLNGAILGLSKREIDDRFDEIAAFADIGEFMDQPVKIYSSGMHVRLAFAIIAHVNADILVIDEALAVGDAVFIQKCMRFIRNFQKNGTLLFVSHDVNSVLNLCRTALWLHHGEMRKIGKAKTITESYLQYTQQELYGNKVQLVSTQTQFSDQTVEQAIEETEDSTKELLLDYSTEAKVIDNLKNASGWEAGGAEIVDVRLVHVGEGIPGVFKGGEKVRMVICVRAKQDLDQPIVGFIVRDRLGQDLFGENTHSFTDLNPSPISAGQEFKAEFVFRLPMLPNGQFAVMASVANGVLRNNVQHHWLHDALIINISSSKVRWGLVGVPFEKVSLRVDQ